MPIAIRGIRITELTMKPGDGDADNKITCSYQLISTAEKVLANQTVGGYGGLKLTPSPATQKALDELMKAYRNDVHLLLGLETD